MKGQNLTLLYRDGKWIVLAWVFLLIFCGCGPKLIRMDTGERARLKQVNIQAVRYPPPSFNVRTPGKALAGGGGLLGGFISLGLFKSAGEKMTHDYSLEDPVVAVKDRFLSSLDADLGIKASSVNEPLGKDSLDELKTTFEKGMVFDFKTIQWMLFYFPTDWSHYRIAYSARSRLIRLEDSKILWQGVCEFIGKDPKTSPTWEELTENNGALLKIKLKEAADACSKELLAQFNATS
jgi:hypothetical protein